MGEMFENAGAKIKSFASGFFLVEAAVTIVGGLVLCFTVGQFLLILLVLIGVAIAIAVAYLTALFLVAFGELVESTSNNARTNAMILDRLQGGAVPEASQSTPASNTSTAYNSYPSTVDNSYSRPAETYKVFTRTDVPAPSSSDKWVCRHCGVENSNNYSMCKKCGQYRNS